MFGGMLGEFGPSSRGFLLELRARKCFSGWCGLAVAADFDTKPSFSVSKITLASLTEDALSNALST